MSFPCHEVLKDGGYPKCCSFKDLILAWSCKEKVVLAAIFLSKFCVKHLALGRRGTSDISLSLALLVVWLWGSLCVAWMVWGEFEVLMIPYAMPKHLLQSLPPWGQEAEDAVGTFILDWSQFSVVSSGCSWPSLHTWAAGSCQQETHSSSKVKYNGLTLITATSK